MAVLCFAIPDAKNKPYFEDDLEILCSYVSQEGGDMKAPDLRHWSVRTLYYHLRKRSFAVPKLQRNFVWDARRAAKLLDSIYQRMPIGSFFLWEMDRKSAHLIRQSARVLPQYDDHNSRIWFVIDGQQRLSVLYQAFKGEKQENDAGKEIEFDRLCFVVDPEREARGAVERIVYRKPRGRELIPVRDILAPNWRQCMPSRSRAFLKKIKDCRERLMKYDAPIVIVRSATLDEIGEVFVRVNSQGMRISSADRAVALMGKLDVSDMARELRRTMRDQGFASAGIDPILMAFNLVSEKLNTEGDPPKLDIMARRWSRAVERDPKELVRFKKHWDRFKRAFLSATQYVRDHFPVYDASYLPSANMLSTLSVFFYHHPGQPTGPRRSPQNRPVVIRSKPANRARPGLSCLPLPFAVQATAVRTASPDRSSSTSRNLSTKRSTPAGSAPKFSSAFPGGYRSPSSSMTIAITTCPA